MIGLGQGRANQKWRAFEILTKRMKESGKFLLEGKKGQPSILAGISRESAEMEVLFSQVIWKQWKGMAWMVLDEWTLHR